MSDCPDCENKAVETEEVNVEAAEKDVEIAVEEKAEEVKAAETCVCKKIAKSIARIIAGIIIIAGIVFLVFRHEIQRVWYEERENSTVIEMIKSDLIIAELPGNAGEDFTYEIKYVDEGHPNPNYYEVIISSDAFAQLGAEEEDVLFNQYRSKRTTSPDGSYSHVTEFGFQVGMRSFVVVCHEEDGQWWVCEECTEFD